MISQFKAKVGQLGAFLLLLNIFSIDFQALGI